MKIVSIHKAKATLAKLIDLALKGEKIIIARDGKPLVSLEKVKKTTGKRIGGQFSGQVWMAPDFDSVPESFMEYFKK